MEDEVVINESDFRFGTLRSCASCRNAGARHIGCEANRPGDVLTIDAWKAQVAQIVAAQLDQQET